LAAIDVVITTVAVAGAPLPASYFNPIGSRRRLANYRVFRNSLAAPLLTVEWSPQGRFELDPTDADVLVQISGGDLMWQKGTAPQSGYRAVAALVQPRRVARLRHRIRP
jgi:hypothetical protein